MFNDDISKMSCCLIFSSSNVKFKHPNNECFVHFRLRNNIFTGMTDVRCAPRQTDRNLNQSISLSLNKVYFKFTRSQGRLQPAAHFVRGNSADP